MHSTCPIIYPSATPETVKILPFIKFSPIERIHSYIYYEIIRQSNSNIMKTTQLRTWIPLTAITIAAITFLGWKGIQGEQGPVQATKKVDTTIKSKPATSKQRPAKQYKLDEMEDALKELHEISPTLRIELSNLGQVINEAMRSINWKEIDQEVANAMKEVKIAEEVMKEIDWKEIDREVRDALKEIKVAETAIKEIDWKEINREISEALKEVKLAGQITSDIDWKEINQEINGSMKKVNGGLKKATQELKDLKDMVNQLDEDGLIDKDGIYEIEVKNQKLILNGKEQSDKVNQRYERYLKKGNYTISKNKDGQKRIDL